MARQHLRKRPLQPALLALAGLGLLGVLPECGRRRSTTDSIAASASVILIDPHFFACKDPPSCARDCDAGVAESCRQLAASYAFGSGVGRDELRATGLYEKACDMGNVNACIFAGQMHEYGRGVTKDAALGVGFYQRACDKGSPVGCYNLGIMYERGTGVAADPRKAAQLYHVACKAGAFSACDKERNLAGD